VFYLGDAKNKDTVKHHMHMGDSKERAGVFKGMFLAECVHSGKNNNWYQSNICNSCVFSNGKVLAEDSELNTITNETYIRNYPNPFSSKTTLLFILPQNDQVRLEVYDLASKLITTLYNGEVNSKQEYTVEFDGTSIPSGIYIYKMTTNEEVFTGKMILNKE
jgi:hypothetical protein